MDGDGIGELHRELGEGGDRLLVELVSLGIKEVTILFPAFEVDFKFLVANLDTNPVIAEVGNGGECSVDPARFEMFVIWVDAVVFQHHHVGAAAEAKIIGSGIVARGDVSLDAGGVIVDFAREHGEALLVDLVGGGVDGSKRDKVIIRGGGAAALVNGFDEIPIDLAGANAI